MIQRFRKKTYNFLRWGEKYTKTDNVYLAKGGFWSFIGQFSASLIAFIFAIIVAQVLPKEVYGQYKYIISIVSILGMFSLSGLGTSVFQSISRGFDGALQEGFWLNLRWSILVFIGALGLFGYYLFLGNSTLAIGILIGGCATPFLVSSNLSGVFLFAKKDFRRQNIYFDIIENLLPFMLLVLTILITKNPAIIASVYFISNTVVTFYLYRRVVKIYKPDAQKKDKGMLRYGKHLSLIGFLGGIVGNIDQVLLFHFVGPVELAIYNFAIAIPDQTKGPLKTLDNMMQTNFANRPESEIRTSMQNKNFWLFAGSLIFVIAYILAAPLIFKIFFPQYISAVFYSQIYAVSLLSMSLIPANSYLISKKLVREQYIANTVISIFKISFLFVGVFFWGLIGLIVARALTRFTGSIVLHSMYKNKIQ